MSLPSDAGGGATALHRADAASLLSSALEDPEVRALHNAGTSISHDWVDGWSFRPASTSIAPTAQHASAASTA